MKMTRARFLFASFFALALVFLSRGCQKADAVVESREEKEAIRWLIDYIRIDTSDPPGNETPAAQYLKNILQHEGIEARLVGSDPRRQAVYARLRSGSSAPALLLLHHLDVVPANPAEWSVPPFSGRRAGGYIWGRGALDVKSLGIAHLEAVINLKRRARPLRRDVILLAVPDEESGGLHGASELLEKYPDLFSGVGYVMGEGGANETIVDRISFWGIEVAQKMPLWIRIVSAGEAGHGAVPADDGGAAGRLVDALQAISAIPAPLRVTPAVRQHFQSVSAAKKGIKREILADPDRFLASPDLKQNLSPSYRALLADTRVITEIRAGSSFNSVPGTAWATLDCRLLPDSSPDAVLKQIRDAAAGRAEVEVILRGSPAPESPATTDLYAVISAVMREKEPQSVVGPTVSPGTSDSRFFRARGIPAYGVSPFKVNYYDGSTIHGNDERIRVGFFLEGVKTMVEIVDRFCSGRKG